MTSFESGDPLVPHPPVPKPPVPKPPAASPSVAGLVLAAGAGRRFGRPKALVSHGGRLFVESAAAVLASAGCAPLLVVVGAAGAEVRARASLPGARVLDNPDWASGMGSSLRVGLAALADSAAEAVVVLPVDMPGITVEAVRRVTALAGPDVLARASFDGVPGHPVLLGRRHWAGATELAVGDAGARDYLRCHPVLEVPCGDVAAGADVDRPEDLPAAPEA